LQIYLLNRSRKGEAIRDPKVVKSTKRLFIVSELFYPEQTSTGYFLTEIAKGLASDLDVTVLCAQPSYSERGQKAAMHESWNGLSIVRLFSTHFDKDRIFLRAINLISFTISCLFSLAFRMRKGDRLLLVTNPPSLVPLAAMIARLKGARPVLLVHDVYPEVLDASGVLKSGSIIYRFIDKVMRRALKAFEKIIVLGRDMQKLMIEKSGKNIADVPIIRNWADFREITPMERHENPFALANGLANKTIIQFSGNIGRTHDIESVLKAAADMRDVDAVRFMFIGYGGKVATLSEQLSKGEMANVNFLPRQPRELLGPMLASATAVVIPFEPKMTGLSVPSRLYNVLAAGVPIIAMADPASELSLTVSENGAGWVLPQGDSAALATLVHYIATADGRRDAVSRGAAARSAAVEKFGYDVVMDEYRKLLVD
jgi:colanic acid biosynthesis glycosyl transferase WcaI